MMRRNSSGGHARGVVPKEMVVPVCQRFAFVLFAMCASTVGLRLYASYKMREALGMTPLDSLTNIPVHGSQGFFLDIGDTKEEESQTRLLEKRGWKGVCVSAFPDKARSCEPISMPATPVDGDQVMVPDCSGHSWPAQVVLNVLNRCPHTARKGVGIDALLRLSTAPRVIDFLHLETEGSEASILEKFPFREFCVSAWTVTKAPSADLYTQQSRISELLTDNNCKVEESRASYSARCACANFTVKPKIGADGNPVINLSQQARDEEIAMQNELHWMDKRERAEKLAADYDADRMMKIEAQAVHAKALESIREESEAAHKAGRKAKKNQASLMESAPVETKRERNEKLAADFYADRKMKNDAKVLHAKALEMIQEESKAANKAGRKAKKNQVSLMESAPMETDFADASHEARQMRQKAYKRQGVLVEAEYAADGHIEYAHHVNSDGADDTREQ